MLLETKSMTGGPDIPEAPTKTPLSGQPLTLPAIPVAKDVPGARTDGGSTQRYNANY